MPGAPRACTRRCPPLGTAAPPPSVLGCPALGRVEGVRGALPWAAITITGSRRTRPITAGAREQGRWGVGGGGGGRADEMRLFRFLKRRCSGHPRLGHARPASLGPRPTGAKASRRGSAGVPAPALCRPGATMLRQGGPGRRTLPTPSAACPTLPQAPALAPASLFVTVCGMARSRPPCGGPLCILCTLEGTQEQRNQPKHKTCGGVGRGCCRCPRWGGGFRC